MATKTIFLKIVDREIPAKIVYEDDQALAFHDITPVAPTHVLIIPKKPIDQIENMKKEDAPLFGHLMWVATEVARKLNLTDGYRLVMNNGVGAGQSVFHVHLHLMAGRGFDWPPG